ncbi:MAG: hypothetical protein Q7I99_07175 [Acholeplasmataceae bacterium]|nr:hypothetical protein [Acholeplasmataceae bacterium]
MYVFLVKPIHKIKIKSILKVILIVILSAIIYSFGVAVSENQRMDKEIKEFMDRAVFEYEEEFQYSPGVYQTRRYYKVSRETSYELADTRSVFYDSSRKFLGQKGDMNATRYSPFPNAGIIDTFITYYFGGHVALNNGENRYIEAVGFPDDDESIFDIIFHRGNEPHDYSVTVKTSYNYWLNPRFRDIEHPDAAVYGQMYRTKFVGLRVKHVTQEQIDGAVAYGMDKVDHNLYNFLIFMDMKYKYGCTDLVSRAYQHVLVEPSKQRNYSKALNDDGFITSVHDVILSKDTYITTYVEVIDEVVHIYYLEDV